MDMFSHFKQQPARKDLMDSCKAICKLIAERPWISINS
jgi:hypothetical protein